MKTPYEIFDYLLRDFAPNEDYKEVWKKDENGRNSMRRYNFEIPEEFSITYPYMVYIMFVEIKGYEILPRFEKVLWEIPILYKGLAYVLAYRKFGFDITSFEESDVLNENAIDAIKNIKKAISSAEILVSDLIKTRVEDKKITISSDYSHIKNKYLFFREQIENSAPIDFNTIREKVKKLNLSDVDSFVEFHNIADRYRYADTYNLLAMIDAYFSLLEHISVLLLPFVKNLKYNEIHLEEFMNQNWKVKLKTILQVKTNKEGARFLEILDEIKEQIRNPASHGHFHKKQNSFYVHMNTIGAIPFTLTKSRTNFKYSFSGKENMTFENICEHFDQFDEFIIKSDLGFAMMYIQRNLPVAFDKKSITTYRRRLVSLKSTEKYINEAISRIENSRNMDW